MMKESESVPGNAAPGSAAPGSAAPGSAAPQCGNSHHNHEELHPEDILSQPHRGWYSRGYLPHFDSPHVIQHITYRLADSLPLAALQRIQGEISASVSNADKRDAALRQRIEAYLDAGYGSCILREPEIAKCVVDTWLRFDGERYHLLEWVVMPNHCHVLIEQFAGAPLGKIVLSWKNYTARMINRYVGRTGVRRSQEPSQESTQVWQREYWDRFIRDEHHFAAAKGYIVMNPVNAGLVASPEEWPWSSAKDRVDKPNTPQEAGL